MNQLTQSYLTRHGLDKECTDINKDIYQLIRKLLTEYSKELFDFFSFQFDSYIKHHYYDSSQGKICCIRTKVTPSKVSSGSNATEINKEDEIFMRRPTAYSIYCNELRKHVVDYKALRPQNLWRQLSAEDKEVFEEQSRNSEPLPWTRKKRFKSDYGRSTFQQQAPTRFVPDQTQITESTTSSQVTFEMDEDFYEQQLRDRRYSSQHSGQSSSASQKRPRCSPVQDVRLLDSSSSSCSSSTCSDSDDSSS